MSMTFDLMTFLIQQHMLKRTRAVLSQNWYTIYVCTVCCLMTFMSNSSMKNYAIINISTFPWNSLNFIHKAGLVGKSNLEIQVG